MAKLAAVKPVKCYSDFEEPGELSKRWVGEHKCINMRPLPCVLMTEARYKKLMAVVHRAVTSKRLLDAANAGDQSVWKMYTRNIDKLRAAIEAAEKAGAL